MNDCECTGPGWCERHQVNKNSTLVRLCQTNEKYWRAWEEGRGPGQLIPREKRKRKQRIKIDGGPGTELSKLLKRFGITYKPGCGCKSRAYVMDRRGSDWCRSHKDIVVNWMQEEAQKRSLPFSRMAAKVLISTAIRRAEKRQGLDKTAKA